MREKWHRHRGWIKAHLAVDVNGDPVAMKVTDERIGNSTMFLELVEKAEKEVENGRLLEGLVDTARDSRANLQLLEDKGIEAGIRIKVGAKCKSYGSSARPRAVRELRSPGYEVWKERHGYGMRWTAEWTFSAAQRIFGESVMAKFAVYLMFLRKPCGGLQEVRERRGGDLFNTLYGGRFHYVLSC